LVYYNIICLCICLTYKSYDKNKITHVGGDYQSSSQAVSMLLLKDL